MNESRFFPPQWSHRFLAILVIALPSTVWGTQPTPAVSGATRPAQVGAEKAGQSWGDPGEPSLAFEANLGQTEAMVDFLLRGIGYTLFIGRSGADLTLPWSPGPRSPFDSSVAAMNPVSPRWLVLRMKLIGANPHSRGTGEGVLPSKVNDFRGSGPDKWRIGIPTYAQVRYQDIYPGIELVYYGNQRQLEYDFVVAPQGDPKAIILDFEGVELDLDTDGGLILLASDRRVLRLNKPLIYQEALGVRHDIAGGFAISGHRVSFEVGSYDPTLPLVIDPVIAYSNRLGGGVAGEDGQGIAVDAEGNVHVTGDTGSADFPIAKPFQRELAGDTDVFVSKFSPQGRLLYSTYIGGRSADVGYSIALDAKGDIYLTGDTRSTDFPLVNPVQRALGGSADVFVAKLSADGSKLLYSTYHGGSAGERGQGIAVDAAGNAAVVGYTQSIDFPTAKPLQATFAGGNADAFVLKLNARGSALIYSTYLGGGNDRPDIGTAIAVDPAGNAFVTGFTNAVDFPTVHPIQPFVGPTDVFVTKLSPDGSALLYSTHLGGRADDEAMAIAVDSAGSAYVTGETESPDFTTTPGAHSRSCVALEANLPVGKICSGGDVFVSKLSPDGVSLIYSTFINGSNFEVARGIAVDSVGSAYLTGFTGSPDFPSVSPLQKAYAGGSDPWAFDAFVAKLNPRGSALSYSTHLGGRGVDGGYAIAVDSGGNAYVTGFTESSDFPAGRRLKRASGGLRDAFVAKIANPTAERFSGGTNPVIPELAGRVVAAGIPGVGAISAVGIFHPGGPIHDKSDFLAFTQPGAILDPERILVASSANFGALPARADLPTGSVLSIDPRNRVPILIPSDFATAGNQAEAVEGRVKLFSANSPAFSNHIYSPGAVTADWASMAHPTGISLNNAFGRIWVTSWTSEPTSVGILSILDPDGRPLNGAPNKVAGGVFTGTLTNRAPQLASGSMESGALATAHLGKSPDGGGRAVFASLQADGSMTQIHAEHGVDGLAPAGTITPVGSEALPTRSGMVFNWAPDQILFVADPTANEIVALALVVDGKSFRVESARRLSAPELDEPVDLAPAVAEVASQIFSSNTTLAGGSDIYVANRGNGTVLRLKQSGDVVAVRRVTLTGHGPLGANRLNGIAVAPDAGRIWVTVSGSLAGLPEGAVIELPAFGAPLSPQLE